MNEERPPFGDMLALARLRLVHQMRDALAERGFETFRRGDGAWIRILAFSPRSLGEVAELIGISRQAATKAADSLERRGYVDRVAHDEDRRRVTLELTEAGEAYALAIGEVVQLIDSEVRAQVSADDLEAAHRVLAAIVGD
jgi:DNA-binding MarR family transcriptional regulator